MIDRLRYIEIYTVRAVRTHRAGDYRSPVRGRGFEFDQHKRYQHGDDYRQIDWNVTARMRHPYVKKDFEEKEMSAVVLADLSRSMEFGTTQSKKTLLLEISAALAFSAASDNMGVGLLGFTEEVEIDLPPKKGLGHVWQLLETLWSLTPSSVRTDIAFALDYLATRLERSTLLFCLSDFIAAENICALPSFRHLVKEHDFVPLIIEDGGETALPHGRGLVRLRDPEHGGEMLLNLSDAKRAQYQALVEERKAALRRSFYRLNVDHLFLRTDRPWLDPMIGFFLARRRRA